MEVNSTSKSKQALITAVIALIAALAGYFGFDYINPDQTEQITNMITETNSTAQQPISTPTPSSGAQAPDIDLPVVVFSPDTFTAQEKQELLTKVVNPMVDYEKESEDPNFRTLVTVSVKKLTTPSAGYKYEISEYYTNNGWGGFLYGNAATNTISFWTPSCMGECVFSNAYKQKYPQVIAEYNKIQ